MGASNVKSNSAREAIKPQSSTKPFTTGQKIAVALAIIGALALVLGVLGQVQVGKLASMGSDWNLGLMIGGGVMVILQVGYLLIQMRKKPATSESAAKGAIGGASAASSFARIGTGQRSAGGASAAPVQAAQAVRTPPPPPVKKMVTVHFGDQNKVWQLDPRETIQALKALAMNEMAIDASIEEEYALYYKGMEVNEKATGDDDWAIDDYAEDDSFEFTLRKKSEVEAQASLMPNPIKFNVKTLKGVTLSLELDKSTTIRALKERIYLREGTPPKLQRLIYLGNQLKDDKTLFDYNIQNDSDAHVVIPSVHVVIRTGVHQERVQITVKTPHRDVSLELKPRDTIKTVKEKIAAQTGIPIENQRFVLFGEELQDESTLESCEIRDYSTLELSLKDGASS